MRTPSACRSTTRRLRRPQCRERRKPESVSGKILSKHCFSIRPPQIYFTLLSSAQNRVTSNHMRPLHAQGRPPKRNGGSHASKRQCVVMSPTRFGRLVGSKHKQRGLNATNQTRHHGHDATHRILKNGYRTKLFATCRRTDQKATRPIRSSPQTIRHTASP